MSNLRLIALLLVLTALALLAAGWAWDDFTPIL